MSWSLACPDWEDRIRAGKSLVPALPLWKENADKAVAVFDSLRLADVPDNPLLADAAGEWFRDIVRALHGSLNPETKERLIREVFCLVPKKNAKTSYGAGLMLTSLLLNERPKAVFLLVAPTQDIAELAFSQIEGAVKLDEYLAEILHVQLHLKKVTDRRTGATLEVMSFDPAVLTGQKPAGILLDELHVVASAGKAASAIGQLRGGMIAYPESFFVIITTQSEKPPAGVFKAELQKARAIRDGLAGGKMLPVLYEFPRDVAKDREAWKDPANWPMVTPNRGRSITIGRLVEDFGAAQLAGDDEVRRWASQHLNVEIGLALGSDCWAGADHWIAAVDRSLTLEEIIQRCEVICVGIDGGGLDDLLGLAVIGRETDTRRWLMWNRAWCHPIVLERRKEIAGSLQGFAREGDLVIIDQLPDDLAEVTDLVAQIDESGLLAMVGLDQIGIGGIVDALAERGIANFDGQPQRVVGISQGYKLSGAIKTAERKLADGTLAHADQPLMTWCVGNAKVEPVGNAIRITKQVSGSAKIDPLMATFNAVALMATNPAAMLSDGTSVHVW